MKMQESRIFAQLLLIASRWCKTAGHRKEGSRSYYINEKEEEHIILHIS